MSMSPGRLQTWFRQELPRLNRAALGRAPRSAVADAMVELLPDLPSPAAVSVRQAQEMVIGLGLAGSSVARHYQESAPGLSKYPEQAFDGLVAGPELLGFRDYFAALAERTGTGHYQRDAYASLVIWNVPTTEVYFDGDPLVALPGVNAGQVLSYTGDPAEEWFFELVKRGQTLELGANMLLEQLNEDAVELASPVSLRRVHRATTLLEALRRLFLEFAGVGSERGMRPKYFMDVFRQFAVHWVAGDIPPSGALDVDALKRDFLLGTVDDYYVQHVRRVMPALLAGERADLQRSMERPSLPERLLAALGTSAGALAAMSPDQVAGLTAAHPAVIDWHQLLSSHARASGAHLMLSKRFLFNPQRRRDEAGVGGAPVVSNRRGTTGMDESILDHLTRMRRDHLLSPLRHTSAQHALAAVPLPVGLVEIRPAPSDDPSRTRVTAE